MLFLGHFSFDELDDDGRFGHFSCVVDVKGPEMAEKAFKKLIVDMRKKKTILSTAPVNIYLDTFIEIGEIPKSGLVTCYSSYRGDGPGGISTYLPHDDVGGCKQYYFYPEDRPDISEKIEAMETHEAVPFIRFEPTAAQKKAAEQKAEMERLLKQVPPQKKKPFSKSHW